MWAGDDARGQGAGGQVLPSQARRRAVGGMAELAVDAIRRSLLATVRVTMFIVICLILTAVEIPAIDGSGNSSGGWRGITTVGAEAHATQVLLGQRSWFASKTFGSIMVLALGLRTSLRQLGIQ